jgi:protein-tyrosine-phosphatase
MAEAFARLHGQGQVEAYSAGSKASGVVNLRAIAFMRELGYDLAHHRSKDIGELPPCEFDVAVTMGCGDECPTVKARQHLDWGIPDPKNLPDDQFRAIRELIETQVLDLLATLEIERESAQVDSTD